MAIQGYVNQSQASDRIQRALADSVLHDTSRVLADAWAKAAWEVVTDRSYGSVTVMDVLDSIVIHCGADARLLADLRGALRRHAERDLRLASPYASVCGVEISVGPPRSDPTLTAAAMVEAAERGDVDAGYIVAIAKEVVKRLGETEQEEVSQCTD